MGGDVIRRVTFDFILRILLARVVCIAFENEVLCVHLDDRAADMTCLGIPGHVVTDFESCAHEADLDLCAQPQRVRNH